MRRRGIVASVVAVVVLGASPSASGMSPPPPWSVTLTAAPAAQRVGHPSTVTADVMIAGEPAPDGTMVTFDIDSPERSVDVNGRWVDVEATASGNGYWLLHESGRVRAIGDAVWRGDAVLRPGAKATDLSVTDDGTGYWVGDDTGAINIVGTARYSVT